MDERSKAALAFLTAQQERGDDHVERARRLLERAIRQRWADGMLSHDASGGYAAPAATADIERIMRPARPTVDHVEDFAYPPETGIARIVERLALGPTEADLFAVLFACEIDPATARLASFLGNNASSSPLTIDTLFEIIYRPRRISFSDATMLLHVDLAGEGAARGLRFLVVEGAESRNFLGQGVRLHPRVTAWLLGRAGLPAELAAHAKLHDPSPTTTRDSTADDLDYNNKLAQLANAIETGDHIVILDGPVGSGRELMLRAVAQSLGRRLLLVSARGIDANLVAPVIREAILQNAILAFTDADELFHGDPYARLRSALSIYGGTIAIFSFSGGVGAQMPSVAALRRTIEIALPLPPYARRAELWREHLGYAALHDKQWHEIAGLYNLGLGGITRASAVARELAASEGSPIERHHVARAVRQLFETDLTTIAKRIEVGQTWDDVVLPPDVMESIVGIVDRVAYRNEVLGEWGFGRKVGKGLGVTGLFSGQPGTGKSMVAGLIARELGLDLYVIDLSRITSKWIGETEKNLARAFDAAEAGHVLLLFDEADGLLGRRTSVSSSNDRHANNETNFILARLEQFHGIAIFTTNIASAIDPAIIRRMSANIAFPFPDLESRAELWRRMIPAEAPVSGPIDFVKLARQFELSGGFIRNVVLRAAFLAAREGTSITHSHLERSARGEYGDRGALTVGGRLA